MKLQDLEWVIKDIGCPFTNVLRGKIGSQTGILCTGNFRSAYSQIINIGSLMGAM